MFLAVSVRITEGHRDRIPCVVLPIDVYFIHISQPVRVTVALILPQPIRVTGELIFYVDGI